MSAVGFLYKVVCIERKALKYVVLSINGSSK